MVTYDIVSIHNGKHKFAFSGLSSDVKPTGTHETMTIANGSTFFELDTFNVKAYDEENQKWLPEEDGGA